MEKSPFKEQTCELSADVKDQITEISLEIKQKEPDFISNGTIIRIEKLGFSYVNEGQDRAVFESDNCVLKIGKSYTSFQNKSEINSWENMLTDKDKQYFAPVVDHNDENTWLTMPKADTRITDDEWVLCVTSIVMDAGIDLVDFNKGNYGILNGSVVCFDYGTGTQPIEEHPQYDSKHELLFRVMDSLEEDL